MTVETALRDSGPVDVDVDDQAGRDMRVQWTDGSMVRVVQDFTNFEETVDLAPEERGINQYCYHETTTRRRSGTKSSSLKSDKFVVLLRDGPDWKAYVPYPREIWPNRNESEYLPTNCHGVTVTTVRQNKGGRGHESFKKERFRIDRTLVENYDESWLLTWRLEKGGSDSGEYRRIKDPTAQKLVLEGEQ